MPIVAHGYGVDSDLVGNVILTDDVVLTLEASPTVVLDPDVSVTVDEDGVVVTLDPEIEIEVD